MLHIMYMYIKCSMCLIMKLSVIFNLIKTFLPIYFLTAIPLSINYYFCHCYYTTITTTTTLYSCYSRYLPYKYVYMFLKESCLLTTLAFFSIHPSGVFIDPISQVNRNLYILPIYL